VMNKNGETEYTDWNDEDKATFDITTPLFYC